ncbi:MAG: thiamine diphosphokinase [candidate division Zixibacteria bacterium]
MVRGQRIRKATLFLNGRYLRQDIETFEQFTNRRFLVAVDGGMKFFLKSSSSPDLLIGDFDSLPRSVKELPAKTKLVRLSKRKDATDSEAALRYCLELGANDILIVQPSVGEVDHFLGNIMLLRLAGVAEKTTISIVSRSERIRLLSDRSITIRDSKDDTVSLLPLSKRVKYTCSGCEYKADQLTLSAGGSHGLRNRITANRATFSVAGEALLIQRFSGPVLG